uniref:UL137 n=1 Tax=Human cytomegalovirus TaxID=10359 RepID=Q5UDA3_HCMV|nr:UL137 [Human betaherpesvirus 5]AAV32693.1 UL137 [Human betaherpesvirus 5]
MATISTSITPMMGNPTFSGRSSMVTVLCPDLRPSLSLLYSTRAGTAPSTLLRSGRYGVLPRATYLHGRLNGGLDCHMHRIHPFRQQRVRRCRTSRG